MDEAGRRPLAVVTGASAGIGRAAARELVALGWDVIATGRDLARSAEALDELRAAAAPGVRVELVTGDFADLGDVARMGREIAEVTDHIDVLVNNAGATRDARYTTVDGYEAIFAVNHLAPFLLTRLLLPVLLRTAATRPDGQVRVIAVSSNAHEFCPAMQWDNLQGEHGFTTNGAYCQSKLANLLFTRELVRRFADQGLVAQSMHPGRIASNFTSRADAEMRERFATLETQTPEHAARTLVWLATAPEGGMGGGRYFVDMAEAAAAAPALDDAAAEQLWHVSEALIARAGQ